MKFMDSKETAKSGEKCFSDSVALRFCTVLVFSITSFFFFSFFVGFLAVYLGELWDSSSSPVSVHSRCRIVSSSVALRSSKVCGIGLLNIKAKHLFYPFERERFRCRYDYYWASVFKVEYKDHLLGQTRFSFAEAPSEALPLDCRPNFGAAWLTKYKFKVNETYDCWYTFGISKVKLYPSSFYGCEANDPSSTEIVKQYTIQFAKLLQLWFMSWRHDMVVGIVSGFSTSIVTIFLLRFLQHWKAWLPKASCSSRTRSRVNLLVQLRRACFLLVYFSVVGWMATQYLEMLNFSIA